MKVVIAFLMGVLITLSVFYVRDSYSIINARLDRIEQYLSQQYFQQREVVPQSVPRSHKGELSNPLQWKV